MRVLFASHGDVGAAGPAALEGGGILLAARGTGARRAGNFGTQELLDYVARAIGVARIVDPELGTRDLGRQLARDARRVGIEDARADAACSEHIREDVRFGEVRSGEDALQNFTETVPATPSSLMSLRPETLKYTTPREIQSFTAPRRPTCVVTKLESLL